MRRTNRRVEGCASRAARRGRRVEGGAPCAAPCAAPAGRQQPRASRPVSGRPPPRSAIGSILGVPIAAGSTVALLACCPAIRPLCLFAPCLFAPAVLLLCARYVLLCSGRAAPVLLVSSLLSALAPVPMRGAQGLAPHTALQPCAPACPSGSHRGRLRRRGDIALRPVSARSLSGGATPKILPPAARAIGPGGAGWVPGSGRPGEEGWWGGTERGGRGWRRRVGRGDPAR